MSKKNIILRHATTLFARKGFKETSMAEVSQMSAVASATIFYHFASKEDLLLAILTHVKEAIVQNFKQYELDHSFENGFQAVQGAIAYYSTYLVGGAAGEYLAKGKSWGDGGPKQVVKQILESLDRDTVLRDAKREIQARLGMG